MGPFNSKEKRDTNCVKNQLCPCVWSSALHNTQVKCSSLYKHSKRAQAFTDECAWFSLRLAQVWGGTEIPRSVLQSRVVKKEQSKSWGPPLHPPSTLPFVSKEWRDLLKANFRKSRPLCYKPREAILRKQVRPVFLHYPTTSYRLSCLLLHAGSRLLLITSSSNEKSYQL